MTGCPVGNGKKYDLIAQCVQTLNQTSTAQNFIIRMRGNNANSGIRWNNLRNIEFRHLLQDLTGTPFFEPCAFTMDDTITYNLVSYNVHNSSSCTLNSPIRSRSKAAWL